MMDMERFFNFDRPVDGPFEFDPSEKREVLVVKKPELQIENKFGEPKVYLKKRRR
jgi:hypothetical protein